MKWIRICLYTYEGKHLLVLSFECLVFSCGVAVGDGVLKLKKAWKKVKRQNSRGGKTARGDRKDFLGGLFKSYKRAA